METSSKKYKKVSREEHSMKCYMAPKNVSERGEELTNENKLILELDGTSSVSTNYINQFDLPLWKILE